uniref:Uncharacterized protein n=1 Tax=Timema poppense TaxID=170557 RepID=A0A7R9H008_TIMPO|nr:unnamed protein product [Timema poppensis]
MLSSTAEDVEIEICHCGETLVEAPLPVLFNFKMLWFIMSYYSFGLYAKEGALQLKGQPTTRIPLIQRNRM